MKKADYHKKQRSADDHALHGKQKSTHEEAANLDLDEIFFVLTRSGADTFTQMIERSVERVVEKVVEQKLAEAANGITRGINSLTEQVTEKVEADILNKINENWYKPEPDQEEPKPEQNVTNYETWGPIYKNSEDKPKQRKDGWTEKEDEYLKETVLRNLEKGLPRTKAFAQVAEDLGTHTKAATAYRWNTKIKYEV